MTEDKDDIIKELNAKICSLNYQLKCSVEKRNSLLAELREKIAENKALSGDLKIKTEALKAQREKTKQLEALKSIAKIKLRQEKNN